MVAWQNRQVVDVPIEEAIAEYRVVSLDDVLIKTAIGVGSYVGELD
jgi:6-phosphofructokinase 1